jgi:hypothetical protein
MGKRAMGNEVSLSILKSQARWLKGGSVIDECSKVM